MASGVALGQHLGRHIAEVHWKGKEKWISCWKCWLGYSISISLQALTAWKLSIKKHNINTMSEIISWVLIIIGISLPPVVAVLLNHLFQKKKLAAETKKIQLENKIKEEITYDQLKKESKHKDIKNKLEIFTRLTKLEEEIKSKENKTPSDQKKLESLEMIKKEFKETFAVEAKEKPEQIKEGKKLEVKKKLMRPQNTKKKQTY